MNILLILASARQHLSTSSTLAHSLADRLKGTLTIRDCILEVRAS